MMRVSQHNDAQWRALLDELQASQFRDLDGAEAALVLPVSDRLVTRIIERQVPASAPIHAIEVRATGDDHLTVHFRVKQPSFFPPFKIRLRIERQPDLPANPVLELRLLSQGLVALAGPASRLFDVLPAGITIDADRIVVRIDELLPNDTARELFRLLTVLELHVIPQRFLVTIRGTLSAPITPVHS